MHDAIHLKGTTQDDDNKYNTEESHGTHDAFKRNRFNTYGKRALFRFSPERETGPHSNPGRQSAVLLIV
jgi:hypothetical protein